MKADTFEGFKCKTTFFVSAPSLEFETNEREKRKVFFVAAVAATTVVLCLKMAASFPFQRNSVRIL